MLPVLLYHWIIVGTKVGHLTDFKMPVKVANRQKLKLRKPFRHLQAPLKIEPRQYRPELPANIT